MCLIAMISKEVGVLMAIYSMLAKEALVDSQRYRGTDKLMCHMKRFRQSKLGSKE